jgi:exonuclease VII large subunit
LNWRRLDTVLERSRRKLDATWRLATGLGPQSVLQRGYAIVRRASGETVTETAMLSAGERFNLQMRDGAIDALALKEGPSAKPGQKKSGGKDEPAKGGPGSDRQGDLF